MAPYTTLLTSSSTARRDAYLFPGIWRVALAGVLCAGALLRLMPLNNDPLWLDESYTLWFADQSWSFLWHGMAGSETFPPLYYSMIKLWKEIAGTSEVALRLPSAMAGILGILVLAVAGRLAGGRKAGPALGVMAGGICALWQFHIHYSMEVRPYSFAFLSVTMMLAGAVQVMQHGAELARPWPEFLAEERPTVLGLVVLAAGLALAPWSHVMGAIPTLITGCYLLGWWAIAGKRSAPVFAKLMAAAALAALLYLPNFRFVMTMGDHDMTDFWLTAPDLWKLLQMTVQTFAQEVLNLPLKAEAVVMTLLSLAAMAGFWRVSRASGPGGQAIFGLAVALMAGHWLALVALTYLVQPVLLPRTLIFGQPPLLLLLAGLPWCLPERARTFAGLAFLTYLGAGFALHDIRLNPYSRYEAMIAEIAASPHADAPVLVMPGQFVLPINYYANQQARVPDVRAFPFAAPDFTRSPAAISTKDPTTAEIAGLVASIADQPDVWVVMGNGMDNTLQVFEALVSAGFTRKVVVGTADYYPNLNYFTRSGEEALAFDN